MQVNGYSQYFLCLTFLCFLLFILHSPPGTASFSLSTSSFLIPPNTETIGQKNGEIGFAFHSFIETSIQVHSFIETHSHFPHDSQLLHSIIPFARSLTNFFIWWQFSNIPYTPRKEVKNKFYLCVFKWIVCKITY